MAKPELHSFYNPNRIDVPAPVSGKSLTDQSMADECDINKLMARYEKFGTLPQSMRPEGQYLDCTAIPTDFREMIDFMMQADEAFMTLPARVRAEFENDPVQFVEFAQNPDNLEKMREYGLAPRPDEPAPPVLVRMVEPERPPEKKED